MSHLEFKKTNRFPGLDGTRCISIVSVMYYHFAGADPLFGRFGVELFFVISGFLITTLLLREQEATGRISLPNFWMRRILRIFPIYFGFIFAQLIILEMVSLDPTMVDHFKDNLVYFLTFTNNWFVHLEEGRRVIFYHAWSLATEEQFYLLWPLALFFIRSPYRLMVLAIGLLLFDQAAGYLVKFGIIDLGINGNAIITSMATPICLGVLAAFGLNQKRLHEGLTKAVSGYWWPLVLAVVVIALIAIRELPDILTHAVMTLFIISVVTQPKQILSFIMRHPFVEFIGSISYGMYIMHMAAVNAVRILIFPDADPNSVTVIAGGFALTILASTLSYYLYEKPILSMRHRFRTRSV